MAGLHIYVYIYIYVFCCNNIAMNYDLLHLCWALVALPCGRSQLQNAVALTSFAAFNVVGFTWGNRKKRMSH